jgi:hypothetical protein
VEKEDRHYCSEPDGFYGEDLCQSNPELCVDCDGDGEPECTAGCADDPEENGSGGGCAVTARAGVVERSAPGVLALLISIR